MDNLYVTGCARSIRHTDPCADPRYFVMDTKFMFWVWVKMGFNNILFKNQ